MDKSYVLIFFGCLALLMGVGGGKGEFIPSWLKLYAGFIAIAYGIYLRYGQKEKTDVPQSELNYEKRIASKTARPSYSYLIVGVLLLSFTKYLINSNDYILDFWTIIVGISGLTISIYGLNMFFKERREKKESGSIE